jgi:hypothetical protein
MLPFCLSSAFNVDSIIQRTQRRMAIHLTIPSDLDFQHEAQSIQAAASFNVNLSLGEDSGLMVQYLSLAIQQKPNARINRLRANSILPNRRIQR